MEKAKPGDIQELCGPNALLTFKEYLEDYAAEKTRRIGETRIHEHLKEIVHPGLRGETEARLKNIAEGKRDLFF
jgi:2-iminoacetate synthase